MTPIITWKILFILALVSKIGMPLKTEGMAKGWKPEQGHIRKCLKLLGLQNPVIIQHDNVSIFASSDSDIHIFIWLRHSRFKIAKWLFLATDRSEHKAILLLMSGIEPNPGPTYQYSGEAQEIKLLKDKLVGFEEQHSHDVAWLTTAIETILMILCEQQTQRALYCMGMEEKLKSIGQPLCDEELKMERKRIDEISQHLKESLIKSKRDEKIKRQHSRDTQYDLTKAVSEKGKISLIAHDYGKGTEYERGSVKRWIYNTYNKIKIPSIQNPRTTRISNNDSGPLGEKVNMEITVFNGKDQKETRNGNTKDERRDAEPEPCDQDIRRNKDHNVRNSQAKDERELIWYDKILSNIPKEVESKNSKKTIKEQYSPLQIFKRNLQENRNNIETKKAVTRRRGSKEISTNAPNKTETKIESKTVDTKKDNSGSSDDIKQKKDKNGKETMRDTSPIDEVQITQVTKKQENQMDAKSTNGTGSCNGSKERSQTLMTDMWKTKDDTKKQLSGDTTTNKKQEINNYNEGGDVRHDCTGRKDEPYGRGKGIGKRNENAINLNQECRTVKDASSKKNIKNSPENVPSQHPLSAQPKPDTTKMPGSRPHNTIPPENHTLRPEPNKQKPPVKKSTSQTHLPFQCTATNSKLKNSTSSTYGPMYPQTTSEENNRLITGQNEETRLANTSGDNLHKRNQGNNRSKSTFTTEACIHNEMISSNVKTPVANKNLMKSKKESAEKHKINPNGQSINQCEVDII